MNGLTCCLVQISGRVQGVGFRMWALGEARRLQLKGWVRNMADGRVEACLIGMPEMLDQMLDRLRQGPPLAQVTSVERREITMPSNPEGFTIMP